MANEKNKVEMGRRRLPESEVRRRRVVTMLTSTEFASVERHALQSGQSISAACRDLILLALRIGAGNVENAVPSRRSGPTGSVNEEK